MHRPKSAIFLSADRFGRDGALSGLNETTALGGRNEKRRLFLRSANFRAEAIYGQYRLALVVADQCRSFQRDVRYESFARAPLVCSKHVLTVTLCFLIELFIGRMRSM